MTDYNVVYGGAANQAQTTFTDQMALNQLDTEQEVKLAYVARTNFVPKSTPVVVDGYGTRIPAYGTIASAYHTPGTIVYGETDAGNSNTRFGYLDDRLIAHIAVDEYDQKQRSTINFLPSRKRALGVAIAKTDEEQAAINAILASRASATVTGGPTGGAVTGAGAGASASALIALIWATKTAMDNNFIDEMNRFLALNPARFNLLASQLLYLSDRELGNNGSMTGMVRLPDIAGFQPFKSSHMPTTNISSATTGQRNTYTGDFRQTIGLAFQQEATCTLMPAAELSMGGKGNAGITSNAQPESPLNVRSIDDSRAFSTLHIASLITGHCIQRPEAAIELKDSTL